MVFVRFGATHKLLGAAVPRPLCGYMLEVAMLESSWLPQSRNSHAYSQPVLLYKVLLGFYGRRHRVDRLYCSTGPVYLPGDYWTQSTLPNDYTILRFHPNNATADFDSRRRRWVERTVTTASRTISNNCLKTWHRSHLQHKRSYSANDAMIIIGYAFVKCNSSKLWRHRNSDLDDERQPEIAIRLIG